MRIGAQKDFEKTKTPRHENIQKKKKIIKKYMQNFQTL